MPSDRKAAKLVHVYNGTMIGAAVVSGETGKIVATSPSLRFADNWTDLQLAVFCGNRKWKVTTEDLAP